jgi:2-oxoglutarate dehydrogenase E2 component (dihydrolipoamide succinyltransferase)
MPIEIPLTLAAESLTHGTFGRWVKPNGALVKADDLICEVETDKVAQEIFSPATGVLTHLAKVGDRIPKGAIIATIDPAGAPTASPASAPPVPPLSPTPATTAIKAAAPSAEARLSPAARVMADTQGIDTSKIPPNERGVITKSGIIDAQSAPKVQPPPLASPPLAVPVATAAPVGEREKRVPMSAMRMRIAERLLQAQETAAILTTFNEVDMSRVMDLRAKYKEVFQKKHGVGLGFMSFFVKASVEALKAFPAVNARIEGTDMIYCNYYDLGIAVSTERGLSVPVLRDCDGRSFAGIEKGIIDLATRVKEGKITLSDLSGGTFTITNGGIFGSMMSTPILNPPQSGILGMHSITKRAVVVEDQIVIRPMMYLAFSYDHRIIDGKEAVSFLVRIKECIENPERLLLEV